MELDTGSIVAEPKKTPSARKKDPSQRRQAIGQVFRHRVEFPLSGHSFEFADHRQVDGIPRRVVRQYDEHFAARQRLESIGSSGRQFGFDRQRMRFVVREGM